jgi:hypothetical protein
MKTFSIVDRFDSSCKRFSLSVGLKKTEVLFQPKLGFSYISPQVMADNQPLAYVKNFKYLGSVLSSDVSVDAEISCRISKASAS